MKSFELVAVIKSFDNSRPDEADFIPLRVTVPECEYTHGMLPKLIRHIAGDAVRWQNDFVVVKDFSSPIAQNIYESANWNEAKEVNYNVENSYERNNLWWDWRHFFEDKRVRDFEPYFAKEESTAEKYVKRCGHNINWVTWTDDELIHSPVYMFYYAMKVCKGRLPEHLDNAMNMVSFKNPDSHFVKRYFGTKRYRIRNGKSALPKGMSPTEYSKSLLEPKNEPLYIPCDSSVING